MNAGEIPSTLDHTPKPSAGTALILATIVLATTTVVFNWNTFLHIDQRREAPSVVAERYNLYTRYILHTDAYLQHPDALRIPDALALLTTNDTDAFIYLLIESTTALGKGRFYMPLSNFDLCLTYLLPGSIVLLLTGWPPLVVHNLFFLVVFFLNGLFAFAFLRTLSRHLGLALLGALSYQGCNFVFSSHHLGHMNNIQLQWIPLIFLAVWQLLSSERRALRWTVLLGVGMGLQVLSSPYYTLFLCFAILPVFVLVYLIIALRQRLLATEHLIPLALQGLLAGTIALLVSLFYIIPRLGTPPRVYSVNAATWRPYVLNDYLELLDPMDPALFIGLPLFVLMILAVRWWYEHSRPLTSAVGMTMVVSLVLMLPAVPGTPFWFFYHIVPLANHLRVPLRCFPIFYLMLISLTTLYLNHVFRDLSSIRRSMVVVGLLSVFVCSNWLVSPWAFDLDLVSIIKKLLNYHS